VLHRDIKTSNILMSEGKPQLCDFGISKEVSGQTMTATMGSGLTTDFAAPEVLRAANHGTALPNSRSSDMFSAGHVLYEAMYGAMAPSRTHAPYEVQLPLPPHANPHVVPLLHKLLAPDPKDRPSAEAVLLEPALCRRQPRGAGDRGAAHRERVPPQARGHRAVPAAAPRF
jgi:serine/threonine protein kinase